MPRPRAVRSASTMHSTAALATSAFSVTSVSAPAQRGLVCAPAGPATASRARRALATSDRRIRAPEYRERPDAPTRPPCRAAIAGCPMFPADNHWNQRVDQLPATCARRDRARIGARRPVLPDFGSGLYDGGPIGIPYMVVARASQVAGALRVRRRVRPRAVPDPGEPADRGRLRPAHPHRRARDVPALRALAAQRSGGRWAAGSGAIWSTCAPTACARADGRARTRPGLPILPGLARYDEVARGEIRHALRFTVTRSRNSFVYPARHFASCLTDPDAAGDGPAPAAQGRRRPVAVPAPGARDRPALKRYGMLLADNGSSTGTSPARRTRGWDNDDLRTLSSCAAATSRSSTRTRSRGLAAAAEPQRLRPSARERRASGPPSLLSAVPLAARPSVPTPRFLWLLRRGCSRCAASTTHHSPRISRGVVRSARYTGQTRHTSPGGGASGAFCWSTSAHNAPLAANSARCGAFRAL